MKNFEEGKSYVDIADNSELTVKTINKDMNIIEVRYHVGGESYAKISNGNVIHLLDYLTACLNSNEIVLINKTIN